MMHQGMANGIYCLMEEVEVHPGAHGLGKHVNFSVFLHSFGVFLP